MTKPDLWDEMADKLSDKWGADRFSEEIGDIANALRSAYAQGERANHWRTLALNVVAAWEVLGQGHHNSRVIERWLGDDMAPAIDAIRAAKETKNPPSSS